MTDSMYAIPTSSTPAPKDATSPFLTSKPVKLISTITQDVGPRGSYGTRRLCKTWGYHARTNGVELASSCPNIEKRTITDDELEAVMRNLDL